MLLLLVGSVAGLVVGVAISAVVFSISNQSADAVMFKTLRTYDFETKTRYALVPEHQAVETAETGKPALRVVG